jgi:hypothetical protein
VLAGSVAELLVAVPCHVYARDKDYCCAGFSTFAGLATGLAVMLFAFGPGVFFLFAARVKRLHGASAQQQSGHPLRDGRTLRASPEGCAERIPSGAAPAAPETPWGTHTRDTALWGAVAAAAGLSAVGHRLSGAEGDEGLLMSRVVLAVAAAAAAVHAALSVRRREPHRLWAAAAGACLAEVAVLSVWWWGRNG